MLPFTFIPWRICSPRAIKTPQHVWIAPSQNICCVLYVQKGVRLYIDGSRPRSQIASKFVDRSDSSQRFIIATGAANKLNYKTVIDRLSKLPNDLRPSEGSGRRAAVVVLATPAFSTWLETGNFMSMVLEAIFNSHLDVNMLTGVVDGLPPANDGSEGGQNTEGFAFLTGSEDEILPNLWQPESHNAMTIRQQRSSITFSIGEASDGNEPSTRGGGMALDIVLPLANTLFRNGRLSTLLATNWQRPSTLDSFTRLNQTEKHSQRVVISSPAQFSSTSFAIPLTALTPPRRVESGLGNIVRQLADGKGIAGPASLELEASVASYFGARSLPKQMVAVWALMIPGGIAEQEQIGQVESWDLDGGIENIRASWMTRPNANDYVGHWIKRGARLHRVLSGGGGWGVKQGLLSLDPETILTKATNARQNFDYDDAMEIEQAQALGDVAKVGSYVQFFIAHSMLWGGEDTATATTDPTPNQLDRSKVTQKSLVFGCIPSTIDDIPQATSDHSGTIEPGSTEFSTVELIPSHFGALSEMGIFVQSQNLVSNEHLNSKAQVNIDTKIDVPYSAISYLLIEQEET